MNSVPRASWSSIRLHAFTNSVVPRPRCVNGPRCRFYWALYVLSVHEWYPYRVIQCPLLRARNVNGFPYFTPGRSRFSAWTDTVYAPYFPCVGSERTEYHPETWSLPTSSSKDPQGRWRWGRERGCGFVWWLMCAQMKLADFGYARYFTEEGTKVRVEMSTLAGTPVGLLSTTSTVLTCAMAFHFTTCLWLSLQAPEALKCLLQLGAVDPPHSSGDEQTHTHTHTHTQTK